MSDPRPQVDAHEGVFLVGVRCNSCDHPMATPRPMCAACGGEVVEARFGPEGTVYSSTVVRIAVGNRTPPYSLAYVDLDAGPRILAHLAGPRDEVAPVASRVTLVESADGDPIVEVLR